MYDCNGMRTQKGIGNDVTKYYYDSSNNLIGLTYGNNTLFFYYDNNGTPTSFAHNGTMYYYVKNLLGDIVQITKQDGTVVAKYIYDVWGKILSIKDGSNNIIETTNATHLANLNPFRYRGYVYDNETGLYYLQSRYYDPITGRFLNADVYCNTGNSVLSTNMFAYCENNAVMKYDVTGKDAWWIQSPNSVDLGIYKAGHTSLLIQEKPGFWWYLYWGNTDVIFRPCGSDSFSLEALNAYLRGFDPRPHHNYYVKSYDIGGTYTKSIYFYGCFYDSFLYVFGRLSHLANLKGKTIEYDEFYENYIPSFAIHIRGNPAYFFVMNNCVDVSLAALLQGTFSDTHYDTTEVVDKLYNALYMQVPNTVYEYILPTFKNDEKILFGGS